ncbi:CDP-glycerol glycerophosphotransferase family protein [Vibrio coralliirubri]|uniref:CDP-glycerol glycerophosphotransferase family protein n=1 Tax=Vibrio coralliirubri TaxID=1516159 RepID=UPI00073F45AB|nr:CDP-glycerol glycerophosphotransferase family protein [Vibrio coralliirubri]
MNKILRAITLILYILPYWLMRLFIPKNKNLWVFGAWQGQKYGDNSKYLFEYVSKEKNVRAVWITKNKRIVTELKSSGYEVKYLYSFDAIAILLRAKVNIYNVSHYDIAPWIPSPILVNLWHGTPLKKIGYDDNIRKAKNKHLKYYIGLALPFLRVESNASLVIASSKMEASSLSSAFNVPKSKVLISGHARNDIFSTMPIRGSITNVIYMPTWREAGSEYIFKELFENIERYNLDLKELGINLVLKIHPNNEKDFGAVNLSNIKTYSKNYGEKDVYSVISDFDILITDYSSVYFDYLLSERPIIFSNFDMEFYLSSEREFYYDYDEITPGPKCSNWDDIIRVLSEPEKLKNQYEAQRNIIRGMFHENGAGTSCQMIYEHIRKMVK